MTPLNQHQDAVPIFGGSGDTPDKSTSHYFPGAKYLNIQLSTTNFKMSGEITDKINFENGAEFVFVCRRIPFAMSCSRDLQHKNFNVIDLDLVNKMKIPLKKIRVARISIQGQNLRSVGVISQ